MGWYPHWQPIFQAQRKKIEDIYYVCETDIDVSLLMWLNVFNYKCTQFGQLILRKIIKIVATRCQILGLNAPNSILAGPPPQTPLAELTVLPQTPSWI